MSETHDIEIIIPDESGGETRYFSADRASWQESFRDGGSFWGFPGPMWSRVKSSPPKHKGILGRLFGGVGAILTALFAVIFLATVGVVFGVVTLVSMLVLPFFRSRPGTGMRPFDS